MEEMAFTLNFVKELEKDDLHFQENEEVENKNPAFNGLLEEYEKVIVKSLITSFGLDFLLFSDKRGGDVQTLHNAQNGVFADEKYENRFNEKYDRKNYEDVKVMKHYKKERFKNEEIIYSGYTNKELMKDGSTHTEHIVSAGEYHRDDKVRLYQDTDRKKEVINNEGNFTLLEKNINISKSDQNMEDFLNKKKRGEQHENAERFEIDRTESTKKYNEAKNYVNKQVMRDQIKHYSSETIKASASSAAKMGIRQCLGLIFAEIWMTVKDEFPHIIKELKEDFGLGELLDKITNVIKKAFENVKLKYKEILSSLKDGAIAGLLSTISATIINIFFTTAKSIGRILRESWVSIVEAVKILAFNPDNLPFGEALRAVSKIIATCVSVACGTIIQEALSKLLPAIPILSEIVPLFLGTMVTGILTVSFLYFIDNSKIVENIVGFANQLKSKAELTLDYFKEINAQLNVYVANLVSIDIETFEKEVAKFKELNSQLSEASDLDAFSSILYNTLKTRGIKMQFTNFNEFDLFMLDKDTVLII